MRCTVLKTNQNVNKEKNVRTILSRNESIKTAEYSKVRIKLFKIHKKIKISVQSIA